MSNGNLGATGASNSASSSNAKGLDDAILFLTRLEALVIGSIQVAFDAHSVGQIELDAKNTEAYNDDTGATRASTMAYSMTSEQEPEKWAESNDAADEFRPGSAVGVGAMADTVAELDHEGAEFLLLDVISSTNYSYHLNTRNGVATPYLLDALTTNLGTIMDDVAEGGLAGLIEAAK